MGGKIPEKAKGGIERDKTNPVKERIRKRLR